MSEARRTILVGVDYSDQSISAVDEALRLSSTPGARLVPLLVLRASTVAGAPDAEEMTRELVERSSGNLSQLIEARARRLGIAAPQLVEPRVRFGSPAEELIALAREIGADLIAVGTHGRQGLSHLLVGSTAEEVVRKAACSVLVARAAAARALASTGAGLEPAARGTGERSSGGGLPPEPAEEEEPTIVAGPHVDAGRVVLHVLDTPSRQVFVCAFESETAMNVDPLEGDWVPAPASAARARAARTALRFANERRAEFAELFTQIGRRGADGR